MEEILLTDVSNLWKNKGDKTANLNWCRILDVKSTQL